MRKRLSLYITRIYSVFFWGKTYNKKVSRQTKDFRSKQGFTLVELIVTTAVLAA
ncbi:type II secretion system protein, partial [Psychrobacter sp. AOP7-D1-15]